MTLITGQLTIPKAVEISVEARESEAANVGLECISTVLLGCRGGSPVACSCSKALFLIALIDEVDGAQELHIFAACTIISTVCMLNNGYKWSPPAAPAYQTAGEERALECHHLVCILRLCCCWTRLWPPSASCMQIAGSKT